ncbi:MAG TPA: hypothetical protein VKU00_20300 [Chthonomonadaceae bacterium]|nr:hypothetical protein [Chthonomonadaceae bacterium]
MDSDTKTPIPVNLPVDVTAEFADAIGSALVAAGIMTQAEVPNNEASLQPHTPRILTVSMDPDLVQKFYLHLKATAASCILAVAALVTTDPPDPNSTPPNPTSTDNNNPPSA